jgi:hypothetical protein
VTLNDFYNQVSRKVDTKGTKINAAETRRVLAVGFALLSKQKPAVAADIIAKGLAAASKPARKKKAKRKTAKKKK